MKHAGFALALLLWLGVPARAPAAERTVFVNPAAGRVYHMARHCPAGGAPEEMREYSLPAFALSDCAAYRRCGVCFGAMESLSAPLSFGQLGTQGLYYPLWQPEGAAWRERVEAELSADLNHDGLPDRVQLVLFPDGGEGTRAEDLIAADSLGFVKVFRGLAGGGYEEEPRFVSRGLNLARVANGMILLVRRDGADYLMDCGFRAGRDGTDLQYTVCWLQDGMGVTVEDRRFASFAGAGDAGAAAPFREAMARWTGDARLIVSAHAELGAGVAGEETAEPVLETVFGLEP